MGGCTRRCVSVYGGQRNVLRGSKLGFESYIVSCDYGTVNPASFGLWGLCGGEWYRIDEYYFDSRKEGCQKTDDEHYEGLCRLCGDRNIQRIIVDPSAASFIELIRRYGKYKVTPAQNDVVNGIRKVTAALKNGKVHIAGIAWHQDESFRFTVGTNAGATTFP